MSYLIQVGGLYYSITLRKDFTLCTLPIWLLSFDFKIFGEDKHLLNMIF